MYSTGCKCYPLSRIQPLSHRWFLIKGIKALVCPFAVLRSRFGFAISRSRTAAVEIPRFILHRRRSEFLPLHRGAEGAPAPYTDLPQAALRRSYARRRRAALIRHGAGCAAPRHPPQGEGYVLRTEYRGAENAHSPVLKAKAPCSFEHGAFLYNSFYQLSRSFLQRR